jgi:predicted ribosomally synthesized peptide with nif11-like leader
MSLEKVKAFYERLATDEVFRSQIQNVKNKNECSQIVKNAGYDFTQQEFEEYTVQLLESGATDGELMDLNEKELEAVFGGASSVIGKLPIQPMYGVVWPPYQPMYGIIRIDDIEDIVKEPF